MKKIIMLAMAASVLGAHAQTTTNGSPTDSHVLQGNFEAGGSSVFLKSNSNADRCGTGGGGGTQRVNQPIFSFDLPSIPAGESVNAATFSFKMAATAVTGSPLEFDMVVCLMDHDNIADFTGADFVEGTAPVNSPLSNGIVLAQLAVADVSGGSTIDVPLTGAALAQVAALYGPAGTPSQAKLWFRCNTSTNIDITVGNNDNDRFNIDDAGHTGPNISNLEIDWGIPPADVYYVAATPTSWTAGSAWSDGNPASSSAYYFVTNNVALQTPATTATFPGLSLDLVDSQTVELMVSGTNVITFPSLELGGDTLRAGVVDAGEAQVDGAFTVVSASYLHGATDNSRDLRVLAQVSGGSGVELSAPTQTIYIDNAANTFGGTWVVAAGTGEFASVDAVGSGSFNVHSNGTLRILGAWDGFASGDSLTVADSPNALVDLGTNAWTVSALVIGSSNVVEGSTYTVAELNAIGANAVFSGTGTIQVGALPPGPQPDILVGWDKWSTGTSVATVQSNGFTGIATNNDWNPDQYAGSTDGTWGTLLEPPASPLGAGNPDEGLRVRGEISSELSFEIENTSAIDVDLGIFHFDAMNKSTPDGPKKWNLEVLPGSDITVGAIITNDLAYSGGTSDLADYDVDLSGLADHTLEAGGTVVFRLEFTEGTSGAVNRMDVDNVAVSMLLGPTESPVLSIAPSGSGVIASWAEDGFKLQATPKLTPASWTDVPGGESSPVSVPASNDTEFLRLIEQ